MKIIIALSTFLLCAVTLSCSVLFWTSMPTDVFGKALAGVTATALEACKFSFFPAGLYYLRHRNLGGLVLLVMGVVLLIISVCATAGFFENAYNEQTKSNQQKSVSWQTKKQQLDSLQQQIDTLNNMIAADAANAYRQRAYDNAKQVNILEAQRNATLHELQTMSDSPQGNAQSLFSVVGKALHYQPESVRQGAFIGLALIIDICGISALLALAGLRTDNGKENASAESKNAVSSATAKAQKPTSKASTEKQQPATLSAEEKIIAQRILSGEFGQPPSVRDIITGAKVAHATVNKIMQYLVEQKQVTREGKRYFLVQQVIG